MLPREKVTQPFSPNVDRASDTIKCDLCNRAGPLRNRGFSVAYFLGSTMKRGRSNPLKTLFRLRDIGIMAAMAAFVTPWHAI